jgi:hypothetical protein
LGIEDRQRIIVRGMPLGGEEGTTAETDLFSEDGFDALPQGPGGGKGKKFVKVLADPEDAPLVVHGDKKTEALDGARYLDRLLITTE